MRRGAGLVAALIGVGLLASALGSGCADDGPHYTKCTWPLPADCGDFCLEAPATRLAAVCELGATGARMSANDCGGRTVSTAGRYGGVDVHYDQGDAVIGYVTYTDVGAPGGCFTEVYGTRCMSLPEDV